MTTVPMEQVVAGHALRGSNVGDRLYRGALTALALLLPLLLLALVGELVVSASPAIQRFGGTFLWTSVWDPVAGVFGAAPMILGTLASSLLALLLAVPLALGVAIYLTEFAPKDRKSTRLNSSHGYISYAVFCLKKKKKSDAM